MLQPDIKMWIMYDKSQLVEQIAKPAEPVNGNLKKSKSPAGAEVKNNKIKYGGKINGNDCKLSVNY